MSYAYLSIAGDYTLVVSAFDPRHIGKFFLRVESSDKFEITPILQEGAGMFSKVVRGEWCVTSKRQVRACCNPDHVGPVTQLLEDQASGSIRRIRRTNFKYPRPRS